MKQFSYKQTVPSIPSTEIDFLRYVSYMVSYKDFHTLVRKNLLSQRENRVIKKMLKRINIFIGFHSKCAWSLEFLIGFRVENSTYNCSHVEFSVDLSGLLSATDVQLFLSMFRFN